MSDVVAAGHLCVDIIPQISDQAIAASDHFLAPGRLTEVGEAVLSTGGAVSNTGLSLHKLGLDVRLVARLGDDLIASVTRQILEAHASKLTEGLTTSHGEPSSYTIVISAPGRDRSFLHCPGTNHTFGPEDVPADLLAQTRLFHFGYPPLMRRMYAQGGAELADLFRQAKAQGATTSLDMAMPDPTQASGKADWRAILRATLPHVDLFLPSVEELLYMLWPERLEELRRSADAAHLLDAIDPQQVSQLADRTLALGAKIVVIKMGHRGLYLRTAHTLDNLGRGAPSSLSEWQGRELWAPCFKVQVMNTVGAGDATIAGFIAGLLKGQSPEEAACSAVGVGAYNVEVVGATRGVRSWQVTQTRIRAGWQRLDAGIAHPGWEWNEEHEIWHGPQDSPRIT